jgi:hypothetical protein
VADLGCIFDSAPTNSGSRNRFARISMTARRRRSGHLAAQPFRNLFEFRPSLILAANGCTEERTPVHGEYSALASVVCHSTQRMALSTDFQGSVSCPPGYPSRVGGGALARWPPSAAQTARTVLPYAAFTKAHRWCDAREGINPTKLTSPYWLYSAIHGSCFQPRLRQRLHRCDQIRRASNSPAGGRVFGPREIRSRAGSSR